MIIIYFLIPISLLMFCVALWLFFWAVKNGQFDDLEAPAYKIIFEDQTTQKTLQRKGS